MRVRLCSDIGNVMTKIDWEGISQMHIKPMKIKMCMSRGMYTVGA